MSEVRILWARAPSLEKLEQELARMLVGCLAENVLGVSHSTTALSTKQSGGIWGGGHQAHKVEYSALVLVRTA